LGAGGGGGGSNNGLKKNSKKKKKGYQGKGVEKGPAIRRFIKKTGTSPRETQKKKKKETSCFLGKPLGGEEKPRKNPMRGKKSERLVRAPELTKYQTQESGAEKVERQQKIGLPMGRGKDFP